MSDTAPIETDAFLVAVRDVLVAGIDELNDAGVVVWHHGASDPAEDVNGAIAKCKGVSVMIYDQGGDTGSNEDVVDATVSVELFVDTTKHNRKRDPKLRLGGEIRNAIMRLLHRNEALRNLSPAWSCRVRGYTPVEDPDYAAWRITVSHSIYLDS